MSDTNHKPGDFRPTSGDAARRGRGGGRGGSGGMRGGARGGAGSERPATGGAQGERAERRAPAAPAPIEEGVLRTSGTSQPKLVAGAIANKLRSGEPAKVQAIGASSLNQALKSIIITRSYLKGEGIDLTVQVAQLSDIGPDAMSLTVIKSAPIPDTPVPEASLLRVAGASAPGKLAGAIAGKVRDGATHLAVTGIGPAAVLRMLKAAAIAAGYLAEGGVAITTLPRFVDVKVEEEDRTGVQLDIFTAK